MTLEAALERLQEIIGRGDQRVTGAISLTPRAKRVIEFAEEEGRLLGHPYVGTEHLLLGLIRRGRDDPAESGPNRLADRGAPRTQQPLSGPTVSVVMLEQLGINLEGGR